MSLRLRFLLVCGGIAAVSAVCAGAGVLWSASGSLNARTLEVGIVFTLCLVIAALTAGYFMAQSLRRRLYDLEEAALLIASGRLHHRVPTMGDTDEIGRVTEQFNEMGEKIQQQVRVLQKLAEENSKLAAEAEQVAALSERQRLARELHDSVSQQLFAITMLAGSAERQQEQSAPNLRQTLGQLSNIANAAQREMRALLLHLRPVELEGRSLHEAVLAFTSAIAERHGIRCAVDWRVDGTLGTNMEEQVFRILQEAVANVLKHADASEILVEVLLNHQLLTLSVLDDGKGFDAGREKKSGSYGVLAMQERAESLGGRCDILPRERGTAVEVRIPILGETEEQA